MLVALRERVCGVRRRSRSTIYNLPGLVSSYAFGDSQVAADRLAVLAAVFKDTTSELLSSIPAENRRNVVDLGCGPGYTTLLLRDVLSPERLAGSRRVTGVRS